MHGAVNFDAPKLPAVFSTNQPSHGREKRPSTGSRRQSVGACINGPDQVLPAEDYCTANPTKAVNLRIPLWGTVDAARPKSIPTLLKEVAFMHPRFEALAYKHVRPKRNVVTPHYEWKYITYKEYHRLVRCCAKAFIALGLERHRAVCILGYNCPEWFICNLAAIFAGGIAIGIYPSSTRLVCEHCIQDSKANIVIVENAAQLDKVPAWNRFNHIKAVVQYKDVPRHEGVLAWNELLEMGDKQSDMLLDHTLSRMGVNECCTATYKNLPGYENKALMFSHDNITWTTVSCSARFATRRGFEKIISYMSLSKISTQILDIYYAIMNAGCTYFVLDGATNSTKVLNDNELFQTHFLAMMREVRPTKFVGMPFIWEKFRDVVTQMWQIQRPQMKKWTAWARSKAYGYQVSKIEGNPRNSLGYFVASNVLLGKVKVRLGLSGANLMASIGAPMSTDMKRFFMSLDMPISDIFGMSKTTGYQTVCTADEYGIGTVGVGLPGTQIKITRPDEDGHGAIIMFGRNIAMGFMNDTDATLRMIDNTGWLHSDEVGVIDAEHFVYLTGKKHEVIMLADGETVTIAPIEEELKAELLSVHHAVLVGEKKRFLSVLLTLRTETAEDGSPTDKLKPDVQQWLAGLGCRKTTKLKKLLRNGPPKALSRAVDRAIDTVNQKAQSPVEHIVKFIILPEDLSVKGGEVTKHGKVKRAVVLHKYRKKIKKMYSSDK